MKLLLKGRVVHASRVQPNPHREVGEDRLIVFSVGQLLPLVHASRLRAAGIGFASIKRLPQSITHVNTNAGGPPNGLPVLHRFASAKRDEARKSGVFASAGLMVALPLAYLDPGDQDEGVSVAVVVLGGFGVLLLIGLTVYVAVRLAQRRGRP